MKKILIGIFSLFLSINTSLLPVFAIDENNETIIEEETEQEVYEDNDLDAADESSSEEEIIVSEEEQDAEEIANGIFDEMIAEKEASGDSNTEGEDVELFDSEDEINGAMGAGEGDEVADGIKMYRLYNPYTGEHFYTGSYEEFDKVWNAGWDDEGVSWIAPSYSEHPVYRLYNPGPGDHHYTMSASERDYLVSLGWRYEGIGWYSAEQNEYPVYREYNPNKFANNHNYTPSKEENDGLVKLGWRYEGISWYAVNGYSEAATRVHERPLEPTYYSQRDPRWAYTVIGQGNMTSTGCVPTAVAMAVDGILHNGVNPVTMGNYLYSTGEFNNRHHGGTSLGIKQGAEHWGLKTVGINNYESLWNALSQGYIVVYQVGPGYFTIRGYTHAIVMFRNDNGRTHVYDPYNSNNNGWYSISAVFSQTSQSSYDWTGGYIGYGIYK